MMQEYHELQDLKRTDLSGEDMEAIDWANKNIRDHIRRFATREITFAELNNEIRNELTGFISPGLHGTKD